MFLTSTRVPNGSRAARPQRDVRLDPHLAALHVGVRRADRAEQQLELLGVAAGLLGGPDVGLGHDLHERRARPVEVDEADLAARRRPSAWTSLAVSSSRCARVIADRERPVRRLEREPAERRERQVVLADLVALGQVRVEVVLAIPAGRRRARVASIASAGREDVLDGPPVDRSAARPGRPRQTGQTWRVRRRAVVGGRAAAEHLRGRLQLAVDLDADDRLVALERRRRGRRAWHRRRSSAMAVVSHRAATARWAPSRRSRAAEPYPDRRPNERESALLTGPATRAISSVRALSQVDGADVTQTSGRDRRNGRHPRGGRAPRRRLASHRLARRQRLAPGQPGRPAGRPGRDRASSATSPTAPPGASSPAAADSIGVVITEPTGRLFSDPFFPRLLRGISSDAGRPRPASWSC